MVEIIFQNRQDAIGLYSLLHECMPREAGQEIILLNEDRYRVEIKDEKIKTQEFTKIKDAFYCYIVSIKRLEWLRGLLKDTYFFEDQEEQDIILDITESIMDGERVDVLPFVPAGKLEEEMKEAISTILQEKVSLSFDSFVKFRLRSYMKELESYLAVAIDEYKMEQEYQMFIHTLRDFLAERNPVMNEMHVVIDEEIIFYDSNLIELKKRELYRLIDRRLLVNHPVYVDSASIAPLLSIAPRKIYLYCRDHDEPLIKTLLNIFEERINLEPFATSICLRSGSSKKSTS